MRIVVAALLAVLISASAAFAGIYIKVKGDTGKVYWDKKNLSGYFKYAEDGGATITFTNGATAYIFDKEPNGFAYSSKGRVLDNYYIYKWNPKTGQYEYKEDGKILTMPAD